VAGVDLMWELLKRADHRGYRVYFLGATPDVLGLVLDRVRRELPGVVVAGAHHGYFSDDEAEAVATDITRASADILLVAMPTPRKERFIHAYLGSLGVRVAMGVGGSFDVVAGVTRRAPSWLQRVGLEWAYRLAQEPRRLFKRYAVTNTKFIVLVGAELLRRRRS
jgi:N-acetylglucosaminyldiphosphoundecaprenol N-acetyl-beta-D-mannosaminyltransferase